jgi:glycosyltransferase involved in cell wall biosynthesis/peptidoglycan/xylan/chitin deacetylase (PgdA/CDA1 family)
MLLTKLYYFLKPYLPWRLRLALRQWRGDKRRREYADVWPIDERASAAPPGWPGWPDGKRFAVVLTHDVEGTKGLSRVEQVMDLEAKYGFRSSFNFVPEGEYRLPDTLRQKMQQAGFEVGVHGLEHDGKLYFSKASFAAKAVRIKQYLRRWGACGFRSPLMQHRLQWLHQIGAEYDASTFDTDPFEPQSDGVATLFPFWVPGPNNSGYVEMPYTLPQDFNLFVVLRETDINIWKKKVDWVVEHGGMVLLITHPDYICFEGSGRGRDEFPVSYYEDLLRYLREKYEGQFWAALPCEVAKYYCASLPIAERNSRKKICMLVHSIYESDNRVRRYAETLARRGDYVDVIALCGGNTPLGVETINGVTVHHIQHRKYNERSKWTFAWRLLRFLITSSICITKRHERLKYDLIHIHNIPDFLVFAAWYPKMTGAKIILDIHDIVPEFFASKFETGDRSHYVSWLKIVEKFSARFADQVIVSNHLWYETLLSRSVPAGKCTVILNHVDPAIFYRRSRTRNDGKFIILFPGSFQWHQGLDIAIEAFSKLKDAVPNAELHLYGTGSTESDLVELAKRLDLNGKVKFCGGLPLDHIADVIANSDLGVVPKRADSFGNQAYSTKIMEFMSQGVPVVVSRTKIDSYYFDEGVVHFFPSGDSQALADAMLDVIENQTLRKTLVTNGLEYAKANNWDQKKDEYLKLVDSMTTQIVEDLQQAT